MKCLTSVLTTSAVISIPVTLIEDIYSAEELFEVLIIYVQFASNAVLHVLLLLRANNKYFG